MDYGLRGKLPTPPVRRLLFGFCPSTRTFVPCFLRTSPRDDSPCIITRRGLSHILHSRSKGFSQRFTLPCKRRRKVTDTKNTFRAQGKSSRRSTNVAWLFSPKSGY